MTANRVAPWLDDGDLQLYHGDALSILQGLPAGIAQTCVTSPPYWGLRDYGTGQWSGGDEACDHRHETKHQIQGATSQRAGRTNTEEQRNENYRDACRRCGAQRVDSQLGLEPTPALYVANMVSLFREVRRVLRDDGTLWLNLGDSYNSGGAGNTTTRSERGESASFRQGGKAQNAHYETSRTIRAARLDYGVKPKDLVGIPWRVAFALQADGWYLRSDIIWSKPNPMPESVSDRPTKAHEYLFLFSKQPRYFYDADAIREPHQPDGRLKTVHDHATPNSHENYDNVGNGNERWPNGGRNRRSVWVIPTEPFPEAHFATYPQELVRPCILAGTSERGECVECGAPWRRQTDVTQELLTGSPGKIGDGARHPDARTDLPSDRTRKHVETLGWEPSCNCRVWDPFLGGLVPLDEEPFVGTRPQLVLDPFIGSGTTSLVARKHGRRSIGIDLSAEYLAIAAKRTQQLSLLGGVA